MTCTIIFFFFSNHFENYCVRYNFMFDLVCATVAGGTPRNRNKLIYIERAAVSHFNVPGHETTV